MDRTHVTIFLESPPDPQARTAARLHTPSSPRTPHFTRPESSPKRSLPLQPLPVWPLPCNSPFKSACSQACSRFAAARPATAPPSSPSGTRGRNSRRSTPQHRSTPTASKQLAKRRIFAGLGRGPFLPTPRRPRALPVGRRRHTPLLVSCDAAESRLQY